MCLCLPVFTCVLRCLFHYGHSLFVHCHVVFVDVTILARAGPCTASLSFSAFAIHPQTSFKSRVGRALSLQTFHQFVGVSSCSIGEKPLRFCYDQRSIQNLTFHTTQKNLTCQQSRCCSLSISQKGCFQQRVLCRCFVGSQCRHSSTYRPSFSSVCRFVAFVLSAFANLFSSCEASPSSFRPCRYRSQRSVRSDRCLLFRPLPTVHSTAVSTCHSLSSLVRSSWIVTIVSWETFYVGFRLRAATISLSPCFFSLHNL